MEPAITVCILNKLLCTAQAVKIAHDKQTELAAASRPPVPVAAAAASNRDGDGNDSRAHTPAGMFLPVSSGSYNGNGEHAPASVVLPFSSGSHNENGNGNGNRSGKAGHMHRQVCWAAFSP